MSSFTNYALIKNFPLNMHDLATCHETAKVMNIIDYTEQWWSQILNKIWYWFYVDSYVFGTYRYL